MLVSLHDKDEIGTFVRQDPFRYMFEMGDLDDFFWPYTVWYAGKAANQIQQLILLYFGMSPPFLLANPAPPDEQMRELLSELCPLLPKRFYANLAPTHVDVFVQDYAIQPLGLHLKMGLLNPSRLAAVDTAAVTALTESDLPALEVLYQSYPGNLFTARMLQTGWYYGVWQEPGLVSAAGIHVYSAHYQVAAIGNVVSHPSVRRQGLSRAVCSRLCQELLRSGVQHIGLTVKADNAGAIALYTSLGFEPITEFGAYLLESKGG
jgi:ribosomal protein S18 acetylase RimI-like enzyme